MMLKKILSAGIFICLSMQAWAQHVVTGTVFDEYDEPLAGATVVWKEHPEVGTTSDTDGRYVLTLSQALPATVEVSFVGYLSQKAMVMDDGAVKNFRMEVDQQLLREVVVTGTRTPKLMKDAPILTRVFTEKDIKMADATNIADLLQSELPGIEFSYSMNQQVALNMQGFAGNAVLFLVDGERVAGETLDNIDYDRLNLDNVERIEIVKGAASSLYGSNAVGGVVNLISKEAVKPWSVNVNAKLGAHQEQRYGASAAFHKGKVSNTLNAQYNSTGEIHVQGSSNQGDDFNKVYANRNYNIKDRLVYTPIKDLKLTAKAGYFFRERDSQEMQKERYRSLNGGLKGNYRITRNDDLELSYTFDEYDKSDYAVNTRFDVRDYSNVQHSVRSLYNHTFVHNNILTVGADYLRDYLMSYQFKDKGAYFQHTADAFAQFDWNVTEDFNIISGLRYDYFSDANIHHVSPKLGLMYKWDHFNVRGSYASGFRAPTLKEMYMTFNMANIFMIYGNKNLRPELSHNFSVSGEYRQGNYNATVTGFYNLVDNRITTAWNKALKGMKYVNMARLNIAGIDANVSANFACGISGRLSYVYTYEYIQKGEPLTSSTRPHTATARIGYGKDWKNYGFNISLNGRFLSRVTTDVFTSTTDYEQTVKKTYPGYTLWNLNLMQRVWKGINVSMHVDNLFNYIPKTYYNNSPTTTGTTFAIGLSIDPDEFFN